MQSKRKSCVSATPDNIFIAVVIRGLHGPGPRAGKWQVISPTGRAGKCGMIFPTGRAGPAHESMAGVDFF